MERLCWIFLIVIIPTYVTAFVEIGNLPSTVSVNEVLSSETFLYSVVANSLASITCTITAGDTGSNFQITSESNYWKVTAIAAASFDYSTTPSYSLTIECTAGTDTDSKTLTVNINQNTAPTVDNLPATISISAKTASTDHAIFTVRATDPDRDTVTFTLTSTTPTSGPFAVSSEGFVTVTQELTDHEIAQYTLSICASDSKNTDVCSQILTVDITDINSRPTILNLDATYQLPELTSGRLLVYTVESSDTDNDALSFTIYNNVWIPPTANTIFELIEATGEIYLLNGQTLDYESQNQYTFNVVVSDSTHSMTATYQTLTLNILDVNESPTFTGTPSGVSVPEDASGAAVGTPDQLCTDPDSDTLAYTIIFNDTYSPYFAMDSSTAAVTLAQTWDFDSTLPTSVTLIIRCSDPDGAYDDQTYTVTFTDVNDNDPSCSPTVTSLSLSWQTAASTTLLNLQCTDIDSNLNAALLYSPAGLGYGLTYFTSDTSGNVSISTTFTMDFNTDFTVTFVVTDQGSPARSTSVTFSITYTEKPTNITYSEADPCFLCTTTAVTLISGIGLVVVGFLTVGMVLCILKCFYDCERKAVLKVLSENQIASRFCDCCRPDDRTDDAVHEEIQRMEDRDAEYMQRRNEMRTGQRSIIGQQRNASSLSHPHRVTLKGR